MKYSRYRTFEGFAGLNICKIWTLWFSCPNTVSQCHSVERFSWTLATTDKLTFLASNSVILLKRKLSFDRTPARKNHHQWWVVLKIYSFYNHHCAVCFCTYWKGHRFPSRPWCGSQKTLGLVRKRLGVVRRRRFVLFGSSVGLVRKRRSG